MLSARGAAAVVAALALAAGVDARVRPAPPAPAAVGSTQERHATRVPPVAAPAPAEITAEIHDVLAARARAVLAGDRHRFAQSLDPVRPAFRARQLRMFDALRGVPISTWAYDVSPAQSIPVPGAVARRYPGEVWGTTVTLRYQLAGFDDEPAISTYHVTFTRYDTGWKLASDTDFEPDGYVSSRLLWDFGPVIAVRGQRSLALGHPQHRSLLRSLVAEADAAVPRVSAVWGADWSRKVVVVVPADHRELGEILDDRGDLSQIAAVAIAELRNEPDEARHAVGNRILVNTTNFVKLGRLGRRIVMTHEVTHVATRDHSGGAVPAWLVEGFADYVGFLDSGLTVRSAARELRADVRAGKVPKELPDAKAFQGGNKNLAQSYEVSWLAARYIVSRTDAKQLVAFYRALGAAPASDSSAYSRTLRRMLGMTPDQFTRAWQAYVRAQLS